MKTQEIKDYGIVGKEISLDLADLLTIKDISEEINAIKYDIHEMDRDSLMDMIFFHRSILGDINNFLKKISSGVKVARESDIFAPEKNEE